MLSSILTAIYPRVLVGESFEDVDVSSSPRELLSSSPSFSRRLDEDESVDLYDMYSVERSNDRVGRIMMSASAPISFISLASIVRGLSSGPETVSPPHSIDFCLAVYQRDPPHCIGYEDGVVPDGYEIPAVDEKIEHSSCVPLEQHFT
eukprot:CAMPEP_0197243434 /NCGR_PEP_ID=MMETSP1429-20130617/8887_1 /TAXON_ID=49237 /ORGANISM="Chaetoceros  sp., Strain UNC1202" /LENGTH=147 /DNA_ID=CAMNT_0042703659 /DNA_START=109 /DNA_END=550 /DNA_ORIENTATION=+